MSLEAKERDRLRIELGQLLDNFHSFAGLDVILRYDIILELLNDFIQFQSKCRLNLLDDHLRVNSHSIELVKEDKKLSDNVNAQIKKWYEWSSLFANPIFSFEDLENYVKMRNETKHE